jgi:CHASE2 domain-containing sensor protein
MKPTSSHESSHRGLTDDRPAATAIPSKTKPRGGAVPKIAHRADPRQTISRKILRAVAATAVVIVFGAVLVRLGIFPDVETSVRDAQMRLNHVRPSPVVLVRISDADYDNLFESSSPLKPGVLGSLISAVMRGNPAVIGIDLDTSAKSFADLPKMIGHESKVVWARDAKIANETLAPEPILGGNDRGAISGLSIVPEDEDGVVRSYWRTYQIKSGNRMIQERSFAWAVIREAGKRGEERNVSNGPLVIRLARPRAGETAANVELSAGQLLNPNCPAPSRCSPNMDDVALKALFEGKMVLIGGSYRAARDVHSTPVGLLAGMDLIAQIIDTELHGGGLPQRSWFVIVVILLFENIFLAMIGNFWAPERKFKLWLVISIFASLLASLLCSRVVFGSYVGMVFFLPVFCAVLLLELYSTAQILRDRAIGRIYNAPPSD